MLSTVSTGFGLASSRLSRGAALRVHAATESGNKKTATEQKVNETQQKAKETVNTAKSEVQSKLPKTNGAGLPDDLPQPEWLPEQAKPVIGFLNATDFDIQQTDLFKQYIKPKLDNPAFNNAFGWKPIPESVNGRAAMLGYLTLALTELIRQKSFLAQLSAGPQLVLGTLALLVVGSIVPLYRGVEEKDLKAYREQLTLPEGVFTESNERVHGRLAMAAIAVQLLIEMIKGGPLL